MDPARTGETEMTTAAAKISAKIAALTDAEAIKLYTGVRNQIMARRGSGNRAPQELAVIMAFAGEVIESRIGEDAMDALIDEIDAAA